MFRLTIWALAILLTSSLTMANESPDLVALLKTILQGKNWGERAEAIRQVEKLPPSERIVKTLVAVVIDPATDEELRQRAQIGIFEQIKSHRESQRELVAPHELIAALTSPAVERRIVVTTLDAFRRFEVHSLPALMEAIRTDDELFVGLAGTFFDKDRLIRLSNHQDDEIRARAVGQLWGGTQDIELCLPLYLRETHKSLAKEIQDRVAAVDAKIDEFQKKLDQLPAGDRTRETIGVEIFQLRFDPSKGKQAAFALRQIGTARLIQEICDAQPIACGQVLSRLVENHAESEKLRTQAVRILASIAEADEADRKALVDGGVLARIQAASMEPLNDDSFQTAIKRCITALKTEHDRSRITKVPLIPFRNEWDVSKPSDSRLNPYNLQPDESQFRWPGFSNPAFPTNDDAPAWPLPDAKTAPNDQPTSWDGRIESALARYAPTSGYVTNAEEFATLWKKWKGDTPTPKIDFSKYIVLVAAAQSSRLQIIPEIKPTGDLIIKTIATADLTSDHGYVIRLVEVTDVKTIHGRILRQQSENGTVPK